MMNNLRYKKPLFWAALLGMSCVFSCNERINVVEKPISKKLPVDITKVMDKHGGVGAWKAMKSMSYEIKRGEINEIQKIDLITRKERIEAPNFTTGHDGEKVWLKADTTYNGNAVFYHNLMFYFIAMPFVLSDDGINYGDREALSFEGIDYPGIRISYGDSIGYSPEDEYYIHYNPDTYQMEW